MLRRTLLPFAGLAAAALLGSSILGLRTGGSPNDRRPAALPLASAAQQVATFAGGCFWSMQKAFDGVTGVVSVTAGYSGGSQADPSYEVVETGKTRYAVSVQVIYDPARITYESLLDIYW